MEKIGKGWRVLIRRFLIRCDWETRAVIENHYPNAWKPTEEFTPDVAFDPDYGATR